MKKLFTLLFSFGTLASYSQLLVEDFTMTGNISGQNGWDTHSGSTTTPIATTTGLTYAGYPGSGVGNAAAVTGTGQDINKGFAEQTGVGKVVFLSALVRVTETGVTTGSYFLHLGDRTTSTAFTGFSPRIFAKTDGAGVVNFGLTVSSGDALGNYAPTAYAANFTYLLIVKYTIDTTAGANDVASLWVRATGVPTDEASLGAPDVTVTTENGQGYIDAVGIRQTTTGPTTDLILDGLRVANTLADVLPLNLAAFRASLTERSVQLSWNSLNEINVQGFDVERSNNGRDFSAIGKVAAGNRNQSSYNYTDNSPLTGTGYYRLKMVDMDGAVKYSSVIVINNRKTVSAQVFPNPTKGSLNVSHPKAGIGALISILSADGKQVKSYKVDAGSIQTTLGLSDLVNGNYLLVFDNDGSKSITKFIKN